MSTPLHDEASRLSALRSSGLLGALSQERFHRIARMARALFDVPHAMVSVVAQNSLRPLGHDGLVSIPAERQGSFCDVVAALGETLVVSDAAGDERFSQSAWLTGYPHARFYAGAPFFNASGHLLGTVAIFDSLPRAFDESQAAMLQDLARIADDESALLSRDYDKAIFETKLAEARANPANDELTGIWNKAAILSILHAELSRSMRGEPTSVALVGIDHLTAINEQGGMISGNAAISNIASCIRHCVRDFDFVGRAHGDTFILILCNCDKAQARTVSERIRSFISKQNFSASNGPIRATVSIGLATSTTGTQSRERVVAAAERQLFIAKKAGRNRLAADPLSY